MNSESLFTLALGLQSPWEVRGVEFAKSSEGRNELHIQIGFVKARRMGRGDSRNPSMYVAIPHNY